MTGNSLAGLLDLLSVCAGWVVLVAGVSSLYWITIRRFDHVDLLKERKPLRFESRNRRRL